MERLATQVGKSQTKNGREVSRSRQVIHAPSVESNMFSVQLLRRSLVASAARSWSFATAAWSYVAAALFACVLAL